ncbi:MAG: molybdenum cofactor biosynthesis protein [Dehalococcoidia bacterium]|nr:molybdenum cofactor biosynthesis protein [Dehalococcoidia bacterium]
MTTSRQDDNPHFYAGILTISDSGAIGKRIDLSGRKISEMIETAGFKERLKDIIPDEVRIISEKLIDWSDGGEVDIILTSGGTGLGPRDVTPEATKNILEMEIPGIGEAMRIKTLDRTPFAILSRSTAGIRSGCLIINLPGSPKGVEECLDVIMESLPHALEMIRGWKTHKEPN